ncbi:MAG TPA: hypothetical protein VNG12_15105 [Acidimicrobiales bacterium]|nr:hypothetical protein [Acidimicrobiales bacterium]
MSTGLLAQGIPAGVAHRVAALPAVGTLFAAFLGYNPMRTVLGPAVLSKIGPVHAATVTGKTFFPSLISGPFHHGLIVAFSASAVLCAAAALASWWAGDDQYQEPGGDSAHRVGDTGSAARHTSDERATGGATPLGLELSPR